MKLGGFSERQWFRRIGRVLALLFILAMLATNIPRPPTRPPAGPAVSVVHAASVPLNRRDPARRRVGGLVFLEGWALTSPEPRFGGISAMHVENGQVTALSDAGVLLRFAVPAPGASRRLRVDPLRAGPGSATRKSNRDTESLLVGGPYFWAGFERHNMIWRFRRADLAAEAAARPAAMRRWPNNGGPEGMARLADGRFIIFSEGRDNDAIFSDVLLFDGDPALTATRTTRLRYRRIPGYRVTDAATLPDGRLVVLNRRISQYVRVSATIVIADAGGLREGTIIEPRELAALRAPLTVDNMEALSVTVENGRTILWIASDDNFFPLQRTLLLKFALAE